MNNINLHIENLLSTVRRLRGKDGCPWDKKQTAETLKKYLLEEVDEIISAIDANDAQNVCEEIGDVLYVLIMIAETFSDKGKFQFSDSIDEINSKLIRRHPHVFEGVAISNDEELRQQWQTIKENEKKKNN